MIRILILLLTYLFSIGIASAYQVSNGSWSSFYRSDGYWYRIYNGCGTTVFVPENYSSDFYNATSANIRPSCIRVHRVVQIAPNTITACPFGSTVMYDSNWWSRIPFAQSQFVGWTSGEMRCDFLP